MVTEFREAFRNNPCLWKIISNDYRDKNMKFQAYNNLLEIIRKVVLLTTLRKKNSLRVGYRKEHKIEPGSKRSGSAIDQVYVPKLRYYSQLEFLYNQSEGELSADNIDSSAQETANDNENTFDAEHSENDTQNTKYNVSSPAIPATSARRKRQVNDGIQNSISLIGKKLQKPDDEYDVAGKMSQLNSAT
ncbi:unnamed protein product [Parnassius mnemosyne]|uniref:MADF domain-containing protein n=1 Tax=Parnassius mnemosyne TaxID=213953 RepID=A0AAV1KNV7_9NEOP